MRVGCSNDTFLVRVGRLYNASWPLFQCELTVPTNFFLCELFFLRRFHCCKHMIFTSKSKVFGGPQRGGCIISWMNTFKVFLDDLARRFLGHFWEVVGGILTGSELVLGKV